MPSDYLLASVNIVGGMIFGYNQGVVSVTLPILENHYPMSPFMKGEFPASMLLGAMFGSLFGGYFCDYFGRKIAVLTLAILSLVGSLATSFCPTLYLMMACRLILGLGVGMTTVACPTYVSENAPEHKKGFLGTFFQLAITFGIFLSCLLALPFEHVQYNFRYMFGIGAFPSIIMLFIGFIMPESSSWLDRRKGVEADPLLPRNSKKLISPLLPDNKEKQSINVSELFTPANRGKFFVGQLLTVAQQLTGINAFMVFAPVIFEAAGLPNPLLPTIGLQLWNFITTFVSTFFVEKVGRRPLLLGGTLAMAISTIGLALAFQFMTGVAKGVTAVITLLVFVAGFESGLGPLFWVVATELFPDNPEVKGTALSLFNTSVWIFNLILVGAFPALRDAIHDTGVSWSFSGIGVVCVVLMWFYLPETKFSSQARKA